MMEKNLTEQQLEAIYLWVDEIPLSRPKRNMARDFSDAGKVCNNSVLIAQIIAHFNPKIVELHNYIGTGSIQKKISNWKTLNDKVLKKMKIQLTKEDMNSLANSQPQHAQKLILLVKKSIDQQPELSQFSRVTKSKLNTPILPVPNQQKAPKFTTLKQIKKQKDVKEVLTCKDEQIQLLKQTIQLCAMKFDKLQEVLKSKDKQIQELVKKIKNKGII